MKQSNEHNMGDLTPPRARQPFTPQENVPGQNDILNIEGFIRTMTSPPTYVPKNFSQQIAVVVSGGVMTLYVYDIVNGLWRQAALI